LATRRIINIENESMRAGVVPDHGARVVHLIDKVTGRDWMAAGGTSSQVGEDAIYGRDEAVGWDECFPTVGAWDASGTGWKRRLRDHGDLWGREWHIDAASATTIATSYSSREFRFGRTLSLAGSTLSADYEVINTGTVELPYLWALHGLLAVQPNERMEMAGVEHVDAAYLSIDGHTFPSGRLSWPGPSTAFPIALDIVQPSSSAIAAKLYARDLPQRSVAVGRDGAWLVIDWDASIPSLGIWMTYGGWPSPGGVHQLAPEPTSASADNLGDALAKGAAVLLQPGGRRRWTVRFTLADRLQHS
jgi:galactose mutarotase-like enzyme